MFDIITGGKTPLGPGTNNRRRHSRPWHRLKMHRSPTHRTERRSLTAGASTPEGAACEGRGTVAVSVGATHVAAGVRGERPATQYPIRATRRTERIGHR